MNKDKKKKGNEWAKKGRNNKSRHEYKKECKIQPNVPHGLDQKTDWK